MQNTTKAMMKKLRTALMKFPIMSAPPPGSCTAMAARASLLPAKMPRMGLRMSLTRELVMAEKAPPMMTPTARSITLPRAMNLRNSAKKPVVFSFADINCSLWDSGYGWAAGDSLMLTPQSAPVSASVCWAGLSRPYF